MPITSSQIKFINSLKLKKNRIAHRLFVAEGEKIVMELIRSEFVIRNIYTTELKGLENFDGPAELISSKELSRITRLTTPNKMLALVEIPSYKFDPETATSELVLVVENLNDPGNLGTLMRIADWFGIGKIVCSPESVDVYNPKTVQSSMGSIARTRVHYTDLQKLLTNGKSKTTVYGTFLEGENIYSIDKDHSGYLVFGSESHGISAELEPLIGKKITIPRLGEAESLNIAIAAAICCAEFSRERLSLKSE